MQLNRSSDKNAMLCKKRMSIFKYLFRGQKTRYVNAEEIYRLKYKQ